MSRPIVGTASGVKRSASLFIESAFFLNIGDAVHRCDSLRVLEGIFSTSRLWWVGDTGGTIMMTLLSRGGSLAAIAAALALLVPVAPVAAQEFGNGRAEARSQRQQVRNVSPDRPARVRVERPAPQRGRAELPAVQRAQRIDRRSERRAEQIDRRSEARANQVDRRSEVRAGRVDRRTDVRADRIEQRGDVRAGRLDSRGRDRAADQVDRRSEWRADRVENRGDIRAGRIESRGDIRAGRIENRGDIRANRVENRGDRRADRVDGRRDTWRGGSGNAIEDRARNIRRDVRQAERRGDWRDGRRDDWRDGRRDNWRDGRGDWRDARRNWRRDDWRHGWNGRPGWDNRDFRRWNHGWRSDRRFGWSDWRRSNRYLFSPGPYFAPFRSHRYSRLSAGFFLDSLFFQPRFFISDPWAYRLPPVYGPYQWVRYYDDVVLVDIYTGEVVDVIHDFFW
jgi:hypothetical protein